MNSYSPSFNIADRARTSVRPAVSVGRRAHGSTGWGGQVRGRLSRDYRPVRGGAGGGREDGGLAGFHIVDAVRRAKTSVGHSGRDVLGERILPDIYYYNNIILSTERRRCCRAIFKLAWCTRV